MALCRQARGCSVRGAGKGHSLVKPSNNADTACRRNPKGKGLPVRIAALSLADVE